MSYSHQIRDIACGAEGTRDLGADAARQLFGAMLDGGIPDLELGALLTAFRTKGESRDELLGFHQAVGERLARLSLPEGSRCRPVVIPSYHGARRQANLTPLVALLLQRLGVPVLVHGTLEGYGRVTSAHIFRELGILPSSTLSQVQTALDARQVAFVPTGVVSPGLANLIALRGRLGFVNTAHTLAKLADPFGGDALRVIGVTDPGYYARMHDLLLATGERALLMRGTEGEPYANPRRRPRIEYLREGTAHVLFEQEHTPDSAPPAVPEVLDAKTMAVYTRRVLDGFVAVPLPIVNQLACCLYAAGYAADFNQAKAIVAVQRSGIKPQGSGTSNQDSRIRH